MVLFYHSLSVLSYIFVTVFLSIFPFIWLLLCFLYSFSLFVYVVLFFSASLLLLSSRVGSNASTCIASTGDVLKATVYILIPSLCMLCFVIHSHGLSLIYMLYCTLFRGFQPFFVLFTYYQFDSV